MKITAGQISFAQLRELAFSSPSLSLRQVDYQAIDDSHQVVQQLLGDGLAHYGINTGFGKLAQTRIDDDQLTALQHNLIMSHACGVGDLLSDDIVRLMLSLKVFSLARGHSGVRRDVVDYLLAFINHEVYPCVPAKGSVGASGDLAPLAHLSAPLIGIGEVRYRGKRISAIEGLKILGLEPLMLGPKEGLALINGTQTSTALALYHFFQIEDIFTSAIITGAMSVDAMQGSDSPFDHRIHQARGHRGQIEVAACIRELIGGSDIRQSHVNCDRVQDPYSLRCQPQVMGAILDVLHRVADVLLIEANAVTDNPLIFGDTSEAISGGNFHAEPIAIAADHLAIAAVEIGAISERRLANLVDSAQSRLPAFLVENAGLHSGFMLAQVTAAALASENKSLAHPASVDSLPTSANQEDHVSMATFAARRLGDIAANLNSIVAIELLANCQALEFHRPRRSSKYLEDVLDKVRNKIPVYSEDRYFAPDINAAEELLHQLPQAQSVRQLVPSRSD